MNFEDTRTLLEICDVKFLRMKIETRTHCTIILTFLHTHNNQNVSTMLARGTNDEFDTYTHKYTWRTPSQPLVEGKGEEYEIWT